MRMPSVLSLLLLLLGREHEVVVVAVVAEQLDAERPPHLILVV